MQSNIQYQAWLTDFSDDVQTMDELRAIANNPSEIEDRFYSELEFGTAGMRGVLGAGTNRMNTYNVAKATLGLASYINDQNGDAGTRGVVIAYDSRRMSKEFAQTAALVLCQNGIHAFLFEDLRPVPVLSFAVRHLGAIAGIVITASHNPPQYNGYKVYWEDGGQMPPERADEVLVRIRASTYQDAVEMKKEEALAAGLLTIIGKEVDDVYTQNVISLCVQPDLVREMGDQLTIVYTPLHGSGNLPVRRVLSEIGLKNVIVVKEQELPDPDFSTIEVPNPEVESCYSLAKRYVERYHADVAFGTDPDCDRVGVALKNADGETVILTGNQIGVLLLHYILDRKKEQGSLPENGAVVKSIVSTEMARAIAQDFGVELMDVLTGFKFIAEKIKEFEQTGSHSFLFGFEESYGYLSGTFARDKDAVNASMLIAEAAAWYKSQGKTLYDGLMALYEKYGYYMEEVTSYTLSGKDGLSKMAQVMKDLRAAPPKEFGPFDVLAVRDYATSKRTLQSGEIITMDIPQSDVLYYELSQGGWICIRPSGTEPKIKIYFNAQGKTQEDAEANISEMSQAAIVLLEQMIS